MVSSNIGVDKWVCEGSSTEAPCSVMWLRVPSYLRIQDLVVVKCLAWWTPTPQNHPLPRRAQQGPRAWLPACTARMVIVALCVLVDSPAANGRRVAPRWLPPRHAEPKWKRPFAATSIRRWPAVAVLRAPKLFRIPGGPNGPLPPGRAGQGIVDFGPGRESSSSGSKWPPPAFLFR